MTQQQLADRVGVSRQTIIAIEGGKYAPSLELAFRSRPSFSGRSVRFLPWENEIREPKIESRESPS
ncbi:MAG: helix-turn-helix transcriptional regulator [Gemmataceae bacterium]